MYYFYRYDYEVIKKAYITDKGSGKWTKSTQFYLLWSTHHSPTPNPSPPRWQAELGELAEEE